MGTLTELNVHFILTRQEENLQLLQLVGQDVVTGEILHALRHVQRHLGLHVLCEKFEKTGGKNK